MSQVGWVPVSVLGDVDELSKDVFMDMTKRGLIKLRGVTVNGVSGYSWEFIDPEEERLKKRIEQLEDTNARLYKQITESYDRRTRRIGVE